MYYASVRYSKWKKFNHNDPRFHYKPVGYPKSGKLNNKFMFEKNIVNFSELIKYVKISFILSDG